MQRNRDSCNSSLQTLSHQLSTYKMLRSFEAVYRETGHPDGISDGTPVPFGAPQRFVMTAEDEIAVRELLEGQGFAVVKVTELGPVVQFDRPVYNLDEVAALLGILPSSVSNKLGAGEIPWNAKIRGVEREVLMAYIRKNYNPAGKAILKDRRDAGPVLTGRP